MPRLFLGSDHRGFTEKQRLVGVLRGGSLDCEVVDLGPTTVKPDDDFNDSAIAVARAVRENPYSRGILVCGSAHGIAIQANRFKRIRAAHCTSVESAMLAREHDDANILCLSAHFTKDTEAQNIAVAFLETNFSSLERRVRRINRLDERRYYD